MAGQSERVAAAGGRIVVLGPGSARQAAPLAARLGAAARVLADPSGEALDALGCTRVLGPLRRSGTIVVDAAGVVRYAVQTANPGAALPLGEVLRAVEAARG